MRLSKKNKFYATGTYGVGLGSKLDYDAKGFTKRKPSASHSINIGIGYGLTDNIRAELGYAGFYGLKSKASGQVILGGPTGAQVVKRRLEQKNAAHAVFASTYYDIKNIVTGFEKVTPYVGVGVGVSQTKAGNVYDTTADSNGKFNKPSNDNKQADGLNKTQFAWHVGGGMNYAIDNNIELNVINYKYNNLGKLHIKDEENTITKMKLAVHTVSTGLTFKF